MKSSHDLFETKQFLNALVILSIAERAHNNTNDDTCLDVVCRVTHSPIHRLISEIAEKLDSAICEEVKHIQEE